MQLILFLFSLFFCFTLIGNPSCPTEIQEPEYCGLFEGKNHVNKKLSLGGLCPGRVDLGGHWDLGVSASFIYWSNMQEGMGVASIRKPNDPPLALTTSQKNDFHTGFRTTITSVVSDDNWIGRATYTRLHGTTYTTTGAPTNGTMVVNPGFTSPGLVNQSASLVKSSFKVTLDAIDLDLARPSYMSHMLIFTPFAGPKLGFLDQKIRTEVTLVNDTDEVPTEIDTDTWFIGPKFGLDLEWLFGYGLKSFSRLSAALLYQKQTVKGNFFSTDNLVDSSLTLKRNYRFFRPNIGMSLGLGWGAYLGKELLHLSLFAGYEIDYFFSQNAAKAATLENFYTNTGTQANINISSALEDLVFHGLTAGLTLDF